MNKIELDIDYILDLYLSDDYQYSMENEILKILYQDKNKYDKLLKSTDSQIQIKLFKLSNLCQKALDKILKEYNNGTDRL